MDGFQTMRELGRPRPELPVIVLSSSENPKDVRQALPQGALGPEVCQSAHAARRGAARHEWECLILADLGALENLRVGPFTRHRFGLLSECVPLPDVWRDIAMQDPYAPALGSGLASGDHLKGRGR
jgi:hypothetical protein